MNQRDHMLDEFLTVTDRSGERYRAHCTCGWFGLPWSMMMTAGEEYGRHLVALMVAEDGV